MDDDSEQALLMGNQHNSNTMRYTDGPGNVPLLSPTSGATITSYGNTDAPEGDNCRRNDNLGMLNSSRNASHQNQNNDLLNDIMSKSGATLRQQFHADALKQIGFGRYQILLIVTTGIALATQVAQLFSLYFIIPSIDLEFCMTPLQKKTLIVSNLIGACFGATFTSGFAELFGRKRTLLACFICMIIFSVVAAFMPVFKAFGVARMIASAFGAGTFPIVATYVCETTPAHLRGRALGMVTSIGGIGAMLTAVVSWCILPESGMQLMQELEEHFSGWHTYCLLMALPAIVVTLGLLILNESPRWLLSRGKEAEALRIYQKMYRLNNSNGTYSFVEMSMPRMKYRKKDNNSENKTGLSYLMAEYFSCLSSPVWRTNAIIAVIWIIAMFVGYGLPVYAFNNGRYIESHLFTERTNYTVAKTFENVEFSENIVNRIFGSCNFVNCTFNQKLLSYVQFENCTFLNSNFLGVTAAYTSFWYSIFNNVKFIDTNLKTKNFIGCEKTNTEFDQINTDCDEPFELYTFFYKVMHDANVEVIVPSIIVLFWGGEILNRIGRIRFATCCIVIASVICCLIEFVSDGEYIYWTVGFVQGSIFCGLQALTLYSIEFNNTIGRCLICGIQVSFGFWGAFMGADVFDEVLPEGNPRVVALTSVLCLFTLCFLSTFLKETKKFL
ncbi:synaptic vesicle glycoprotein 2B-like [Eupeodes corollae]|uniref:synaptic vesicle glycoprotein 2B-like n=1 Tax=Eupeodes corollae TaxID=290404 RepID=UPI00248F7246|nr:synaptic vesicle glycoprotein 2B-like [Eupeodes corollae]XP_055920420.1 synaptic vesicle glycoprotein 2B-like [Eupeodes corollae]